LVHAIYFDLTVLNLQVIDLKTQLSYFRKVSKELRQQLGNAETTALLAKAVYLINIGINDYEISLSENSSNTRTAEKHAEMVVGNITSVIKVCSSFFLLCSASKHQSSTILI